MELWQRHFSVTALRFVFEESGKTCQVSAFSPPIAASTLPIVDAIIIYDCPYSLQFYMLMIRNALYVKDMEGNLIPPFLLREAGLTVDECAKIHAHPQPTAQNHSISSFKFFYEISTNMEFHSRWTLRGGHF